jgi:hypothetical protein
MVDENIDCDGPNNHLQLCFHPSFVPLIDMKIDKL